MTLQSLLIAVVAVLSIGTASVVIEQFLVREALKREAVHFWELYHQDPSHPPPNTENLKGYVSPAGSEQGIPEKLRGLGLGYHKVRGQAAHTLLYTTASNGTTLHLLFDGHSVFRLAVFFGIFPLTIVLLLIYLTAWWVFRQSTSLLNPIVWLANKFDNFDPADPKATLEDVAEMQGDHDWEVDKLFSSFRNYSQRIQQFVKRERAFTRDASHEFRTPLTVIKIASDMLLSEPSLKASSLKHVMRIQGASRDLEGLVDAFLILARETDKEFEYRDVVVRGVVEQELEKVQTQLPEKMLNVKIVEEHALHLRTAQSVLSIVLGNLIRNAFLYTDEGSVTVTIKANAVSIADTGVGMDEGQIKKVFQPYYRFEPKQNSSRSGYGIGLTIVERLCNRFDWKIDLQSKAGQGTTFTVSFQ